MARCFTPILKFKEGSKASFHLSNRMNALSRYLSVLKHQHFLVELGGLFGATNCGQNIQAR